ncbi:MAG: peptide chain release factor N(5)-glutamine methyltransferase [Bacteroidota bacterium]
MTFRELEKELTSKLEAVYDTAEATAIIRYVLDANAVVLRDEKDGEAVVDDELAVYIFELLPRLLKMEPVQYVTGLSWFCDLKLKVTPDVLIPRPETEELVYKIKDQTDKMNCRILDIGTGSGCIALGLKKMFPEATVTGIDISEEALTLARTNARMLRLAVNFHQLDIFNYQHHMDFMHTYERFDIIVSNPPYIPVSDKITMNSNVLLYEPHIALFVNDDDDLVYYRHIADFARIFMDSTGRIYFEVHQQRVDEVKALLTEKEFIHIKASTDISGNNRFVEAQVGP